MIHLGVIARLFRQNGVHSSRFVLFSSFWRLFTIKMVKSVKAFPFSFWKTTIFFFCFTSHKSTPRHYHAKLPPSDLTPWILTLLQSKPSLYVCPLTHGFLVKGYIRHHEVLHGHFPANLNTGPVHLCDECPKIYLKQRTLGTSMYYYMACNCSMCNLLLLGKSHFFWK